VPASTNHIPGAELVAEQPRLRQEAHRRVRAVRHALGDDGQLQRCIRTVHGRGYRFVAPVDELAGWWGERCRAATSPGAARALIEMNSLVDVPDVLGAAQAPTLVLHRRHDIDASVEEGRYLAEHIPGARFIELEGADHFIAVDPDQILDPVEDFVHGLRDRSGHVRWSRAGGALWTGARRARHGRQPSPLRRLAHCRDRQERRAHLG
jgi:pimeloyl-ACP methyl ester carboxylesterase